MYDSVTQFRKLLLQEKREKKELVKTISPWQPLANLRNELSRLKSHKFDSFDRQVSSQITENSFVMLCLNAQSLNAHVADIITDETFMKASLFCFVETRYIDIIGYRCCTNRKIGIVSEKRTE